MGLAFTCGNQHGRLIANEFWLRILLVIPKDAGGDQVGYAQPIGIPSVNVFYPTVDRLVQNLDVDPGRILGAVVLHEIGHLYLGTNQVAHSLNGVMSGTWSRREVDLADNGKLKFMGDQGERIRAAIAARHQHHL